MSQELPTTDSDERQQPPAASQPAAVEPEPLPPVEAEADALAELQRLDTTTQASQEAFDPGYGLSEPTGPLGVPLQPLTPLASPDPGPAATQLHVLEDLYAAHPDIFQGDKWLRVYRQEPPRWQGHRIDGFIENVQHPLSQEEFADRYGGGVYYVYVMGSTRGYDDEGRPRTKTLDKLRVKIPGQPKVGTNNGRDDTMGANPQSWAVAPHEHKDVALKKLEISHAERRDQRRREEELLRTRGLPPDVLTHIEKASEKRANEVRASLTDQINHLTRQNEGLHDQLAQKDNTIQTLREKILEIQSEVAQKLHQHETDKIREIRQRAEADVGTLKAQHEAEVKRLTEQHSTTLERLAKEHQQAMRDMTDRHSRERHEYENRAQQERSRLLDETTRREAQLSSDADNRLRNQREQYEGRLAELHRTYEGRLSDQARSFEREISSITNQTAREIESIRSVESNQASLARETANLQIGTAQDQARHLQSQLDAAHAELADLRAKVNKPPLEAIQEARALTSQLGDRPDPPDWKSELITGLKDVGKEAAKAIASSQQQQQQAAIQQARQQWQQQQPAATAPPSPYQVPTPQMQPAAAPQSPPWVPTPESPWEGPPDPYSASAGADEPVAVHHDPTPPATPQGFVDAFDPPTTPRPPASQPGPASPMMRDEPPPPSPSEPASADQQQSAPAAQFEVNKEQLDEFERKLSLAIETGAVPPAEFARRFIEEAGVPLTAAILQRLSADQLVDNVAASDPNSPIVTRFGRNYVRALWAAATHLTRASA